MNQHAAADTKVWICPEQAVQHGSETKDGRDEHGMEDTSIQGLWLDIILIWLVFC